MNIKTIVTGSWEVQKADLNLRFAALTSKTPTTGETVKSITTVTKSIVATSSRIIVTGMLLMGACTLTHAKSDKTYLTGLNRANTTIDMASSEYGNGVDDKNTSIVSNVGIQTKAVFMPKGVSIFGDDKYLKNKETGKRYTDFQVLDTKGMNKEQVMLGLLTNSLDRTVRYDEKGLVDPKVIVASIAAPISATQATIVPKNFVNVNVPSVAVKGKSFIILGENDYRYFDGKHLAGSKRLISELSKGKPITEATFYYELKSVGIVNSSTTLLQFTQMNIAQQQNLLKVGTLAADF